MIYIMLIFISTYLGQKIDKYKKEIDGYYYFARNKWYKSKCFYIYLILLLLISLVVLIRYDVGTDQLYYANIRVGRMIADKDISIPLGYHWLLRGMHLLINDTLILYNTTTIIEIIIFLYCFFKEGDDFKLCLVLFFLFGAFNVSLNISRQMLAVAFGYLGIYQYKKNKYIFAALCVAIAISFHTTSVLFLLIPIIERVNLNKGIRPIIISLAILVLQKPLLYLLLNVSKSISVLGDYYAYFSGNYFTDGYSINLLVLTLAPLIVFNFYKKYAKKNNDNNIYFSMSLISCVPGILNNLIPNSDRFIYMFIPATCIYAAQLSKDLSSKNRKTYYAILTIIGILFFSYYVLYLNCGETIPYKTWIGR